MQLSGRYACGGSCPLCWRGDGVLEIGHVADDNGRCKVRGLPPLDSPNRAAYDSCAGCGRYPQMPVWAQAPRSSSTTGGTASSQR